MKNNPTKVVLHCAATPDYPDSSKKYDLFGAKDIDTWHKERGWSEIGYHYVVRRTGIVEIGSRHWSEYGAHVKGHNKDSLGVCYVGTAKPTDEQVNGILFVFNEIFEKFGITPDNWFGHYELYSGKSCPGLSMEVVREMLKIELKSSSTRVATVNKIGEK